jgi:hypothetical protein
MGIEISKVITCDKCGRSPGRSKEQMDTATAVGMTTDHDLDSALYGWLALEPYHLSQNGMAHNEIPSDDIVLCPDCWPTLLLSREALSKKCHEEREKMWKPSRT